RLRTPDQNAPFGYLYNYWWFDDNIAPLPYDITGGWHHVAATFDGTTRVLYLDGVAIHSSGSSGTLAVPDTSNFAIGATGVGYNEPFNGSIDDVRIWNVARSAAQINFYMRQRLAGNESGLAANWHFDEGSGTTAHDATGTSGNDATLNGTTAFVASTAPID